MLKFIISKIKNKKWMSICLLAGMTLFIGICICHPGLESRADNELLQRLFSEYAEKENEFPAVLTRTEECSIEYYKNTNEIYSLMDSYENLWMRYITTDCIAKQEFIHPGISNSKTNLNPAKKTVDLGVLRTLEEHIDIVNGSDFNVKTSDGTYPCIISESTMDKFGYVTGEIITYDHIKDKKDNSLKLEIVGIFTKSDDFDNYWNKDITEVSDYYFVSENVLDDIVEKYNITTLSYEEYVMVDYTKINMENALQYKSFINQFSANDDKFSSNLTGILKEYAKSSRNIKLILSVLELPCIVLLVLFLYMVSDQLLNAEEGEIAMLRSRGMKKSRVVLIYTIQALILSACGFAIGIVTAGIIYGFNWRMPLYGLAATVVSIAFMIIPAIKSSSLTIVSHKSQKTYSDKKMFWEKFFIDFILLAISMYLLINYKKQSSEIAENVINGTAIDPLIFLDASLFIFACGLVFIRFTKYLIVLIDRIGKRKWKPASYAAFLQIIRTFNKQCFISIFLIMTLANGIFNVNMARTVNTNMEQRIEYNMGSELIVEENWRIHVVRNYLKGTSRWYYDEPDYSVYDGLITEKLAQNVTRVINNKDATAVKKSNIIAGCQLMGINTKEFGETVGLLDCVDNRKLYNSLNAMASEPNGVIISSDLADELNVGVGDNFTYTKQAPVEDADEIVSVNAKVMAITDDFYGFKKYDYSEGENGEISEKKNYLIVANYAELINENGLCPYSVWIKKCNNVSDEQIINYLTDKSIKLTKIMSAEKERNNYVSSPAIRITNQMFDISFAVSILICFIGFLLYWIMSIKNRQLLFGIYRAMGVRMGEINLMLVMEQIFSSLLSVVMGIVTGFISTFLFIRLIALVYMPEKHNLSIKMYFSASDFIRLGIIVVLMFLICFVIIRKMLKNMNIAKALKLGED